MASAASDDIVFKECIDSLSPNVTILSKEESNNLWKIFKQRLPIVFWGRIDWNKIDKKFIINSPTEIIPTLEQLSQKSLDLSIYILWNDASVPVIKTDLHSAIAFIDDITCVGPDTWFLNLEEGYIVEFFHEGEIVVGYHI